MGNSRDAGRCLPHDLVEEVAALYQEIGGWLPTLRRDLHMQPEVGWTEFRTTAIVLSHLQELGFELHFGRRLYGDSHRAGLPDASDAGAAWECALLAAERSEIDAGFLEQMKGGYTGCVATWRTGKPGPTLAFRVDIDALPVTESVERSHRPTGQGWMSRRPGVMHACGHDAHTAIGIGLARLIARIAPTLIGEVRLIFQPAEEGGRGAAALVEAGQLDGVDCFVALHLGLGAPEGTVAVAANGFLATSKYEVTFTGKSAHAGRAPEKGRNALLAAATAALNLHTLTQFSTGHARLNVGMLRAGTALNVVPAEAVMAFEVRGENDKVHVTLEERALRTVRAAAEMHEVGLSTDRLGYALSCSCDEAFATGIADALRALAPKIDVVPVYHFGASEDATLMMNRVQQQGGEATLGVIGTQLRGDHHQPNFDVSDASIVNGLAYFTAALLACATGSGNSRSISSTR